jgi:hypothetical protein
MGLMWAGVAEALVAAAVGTWLYLTLPSDAVWGPVLWGVALVSLILSVTLGRGPARGEEANADPAEHHEPAEAVEPRAHSVPEPAPVIPPAVEAPSHLPVPDQGPLVIGAEPSSPALPERVRRLGWDVARSRWAWAAAEAQVDLTLQGEAPREVRTADTRQLRRRTDAIILSQGFLHLARGEAPQWDAAALAPGWTSDLVAARLRELAAEEEDLHHAAALWAEPPPADHDVRTDVALARERHERLRGTERRWEQVSILTLGYQAIQAALTDSRHPPREEDN